MKIIIINRKNVLPCVTPIRASFAWVSPQLLAISRANAINSLDIEFSQIFAHLPNFPGGCNVFDYTACLQFGELENFV